MRLVLINLLHLNDLWTDWTEERTDRGKETCGFLRPVKEKPQWPNLVGHGPGTTWTGGFWHYRTSGLRRRWNLPKPSSSTNSNSSSLWMWLPKSVLMLQIILDTNIKSLLEALCYSELRRPQSTVCPDKLLSGMPLRPPSFSPDLQEDRQRLAPLPRTPSPHPPEVQAAATGHHTSRRRTFRPGLCLSFRKYFLPRPHLHLDIYLRVLPTHHLCLSSRRLSFSRPLKVPTWLQPTSFLIPPPLPSHNPSFRPGSRLCLQGWPSAWLRLAPGSSPPSPLPGTRSCQRSPCSSAFRLPWPSDSDHDLHTLLGHVKNFERQQVGLDGLQLSIPDPWLS